MRIVSLLPAATDWLVAFGLADRIVGRSHACDAPEVAAAPALTRPTVNVEGPSAEIDRAVRERLQAQISLFEVDLDRLRALAPDLVVTQTTCGVCAVDADALATALASDGSAPALYDFAPSTYKATLDAALALARQVGCLPSAFSILAEGERRLRRIGERLGLERAERNETGPTVAVIEWVEPPMSAGHWTPDLVAHAGGRAVLTESGTPSRWITMEDLAQTDPEVIVAAACGLSVEGALRDLPHLAAQPSWPGLRAVRDGRVFAADGDRLFNRPGPRLMETVEALAWALHGIGAAPEPDRLRRVRA